MRTTSSLAVLALTSTLLLAGCGSNDAAPVADDPATDTATSTPSSDAPTTDPTSETPTESGDPSDPATSSAPDEHAVPVYFVGDSPDGNRLYREFRDVTGPDTVQNKMAQAMALLVTGRALDPDYTSLVPGGMHVTDVTLADGKILVQVGADSQIAADKSVSPDDAQLAVQQIVYTLQGVSQTQYPVQVVQSDGSAEVPVPLLGVDTTTGVAAEEPLKVLNLVSVTSPEEGSTQSGSFTASGVASSFEANVPWQVLDADGKTVLSGAATAEGYLDKLYPWETDVDVSGLAPGDYTFVASTDDPAGKGDGGSKPSTDTKDFSVQ